MIRYIFIIFVCLTSLSYADEYFCEGESRHSIYVTDGKLNKQKHQFHKTKKKFKMKINYYDKEIFLKYLENTQPYELKYKIFRDLNGLFGIRYIDKDQVIYTPHIIAFNDLVNTVTQHATGLQSSSIVVSKCTKL